METVSLCVPAILMTSKFILKLNHRAINNCLRPLFALHTRSNQVQKSLCRQQLTPLCGDILSKPNNMSPAAHKYTKRATSILPSWTLALVTKGKYMWSVTNTIESVTLTKSLQLWQCDSCCELVEKNLHSTHPRKNHTRKRRNTSCTCMICMQVRIYSISLQHIASSKNKTKTHDF